jgi:hypothetical protein
LAFERSYTCIEAGMKASKNLIFVSDNFEKLIYLNGIHSMYRGDNKYAETGIFGKGSSKNSYSTESFDKVLVSVNHTKYFHRLNEASGKKNINLEVNVKGNSLFVHLYNKRGKVKKLFTCVKLD